MKKSFLPVIAIWMFSVGHSRAESLEIDKQNSRIQVDAKATGHAFTGTLGDYTATATGDGKTNDPATFSLQWDFNDLKTGDAKRDKEMISWLGGGKPKGSFTFKKSWSDKAGKTWAQGELTINSVSKTVTLPFAVTRNGQDVTIDGTASMDYQNFKLPIIRNMMVMTVDPQLKVRFHLVGKIK